MVTCTCIVIAFSIMVYSLIFQVLPPTLNKQSLLNVPFPDACLDLCTSHGSPALSSPYSLIIQTALTDPVAALSFIEFKLAHRLAVCLIVSVASSSSFIVELRSYGIILILIPVISYQSV